MNTTVKKILLWIALPFVVAAVYLLIHAAMFLLFYLQTLIFNTNIDSYVVFLYLIAPGTAAYFAINVGSYMAPALKKTVALTIYIVLLLVLGVAFLYRGDTAGIWWLGSVLVQIAAGALAIWHIVKEERRTQLLKTEST